jgi:hypothetical protein
VPCGSGSASGGLDYRSSALVTLHRRHVPLAEIKRVRRGLISTRSRSDNTSEISYIIVDTFGELLEFGQSISEQEQDWLVAVLNRYLDVLHPDRPPAGDEERDGAAGAEEREERPDRPVVLRPSPVPLRPPSDSGARLRRGPENVEFSWRGRWSIADIAGGSTFCLFWNGLVSMFVYQLFQQFQWGLCLFLIPFEVIGLLLFVVWLGTVTAPAWRRAWTFGASEITRLYSGFGIGWARRYEGDALDRIELRPSAGIIRPGAHYSLSFVRADGTELLEVGALTEGEARWMADVLFRDFPGWFSSLPQAAREETGRER